MFDMIPFLLSWMNKVVHPAFWYYLAPLLLLVSSWGFAFIADTPELTVGSMVIIPSNHRTFNNLYKLKINGEIVRVYQNREKSNCLYEHLEKMREEVTLHLLPYTAAIISAYSTR